MGGERERGGGGTDGFEKCEGLPDFAPVPAQLAGRGDKLVQGLAGKNDSRRQQCASRLAARVVFEGRIDEHVGIDERRLTAHTTLRDGAGSRGGRASLIGE